MRPGGDTAPGPAEAAEAPELTLGRLMSAKRWAEALAFYRRHAAYLDGSGMHWAQAHVAFCVALPERASLAALSAPEAVRRRLAALMPDFVLESIEPVPHGFIALCCLRLRGRDRATGAPMALFEKVLPRTRARHVAREIALFDAVTPEALRAPRLLGHSEEPDCLVMLYEHAGDYMLPRRQRAVLDRLRALHWQVRLPPSLRAPVRHEHKALFDPERLRSLAARAGVASGQTEALAKRLPTLAVRAEAMPQFPLHRDLKPTNVVTPRRGREMDFDLLRVVDWEKWRPAPVGAGVSVSAADLADPGWHRRLAALDPGAPMVAMLHALHHGRAEATAPAEDLIAALLAEPAQAGG